MKKLLFIVFLTSRCWASCPLYTYPENPKLNQEITNICQSISNSVSNNVSSNYASISSATIPSLTVSSLTVTHVSGPFSNWASYTPSFSAGWGSVTNKSFFYRRVGDTLEVHGSFTTGTIAASSGTISLPSGLSVDATKFVGSSKDFIGFAWDLEAAGSASTHLRYLFWNGTTNEAVLNDGSSPFSASNVNGTWGNNSGGTADFKVPISGWSF